MVKINFIFLLCLFPSISMALSDACTNPSEYIIDKRCYVQDKNLKPYNAIVLFGTCAGT